MPHGLVQIRHLLPNHGVDCGSSIYMRYHADYQHFQEQWSGASLRQLQWMLLAPESELVLSRLGERTHDAEVQHERSLNFPGLGVDILLRERVSLDVVIGYLALRRGL